MNFRALLAASAVVVGSVAFQVSPAFAALSEIQKSQLTADCAGDCSAQLNAAAGDFGPEDVAFVTAILKAKAVAGVVPAAYAASYTAASNQPGGTEALGGYSTGTGAGGVAGNTGGPTGGQTGGKSDSSGKSPVSPLASLDDTTPPAGGSANGGTGG